ncbi:MAG: hypothetical protein IKI77_05785 [Oscillospiraceae bacterium]|nr:hypothetical protein [Oscillospiraceae bacterium]
MHKHAGEYAAVFLFGFFLYAMLEIAGRGRTHWTMGILGGTALVYLYSMEHRLREPLWMRALLGAGFVTASEFAAGVFDNLIMGWAVWDYSDRTGNLLGQICPLFSGIWYLLCLFGCMLCAAFYRQYHPTVSPPAPR